MDGGHFAHPSQWDPASYDQGSLGKRPGVSARHGFAKRAPDPARLLLPTPDWQGGDSSKPVDGSRECQRGYSAGNPEQRRNSAPQCSRRQLVHALSTSATQVARQLVSVHKSSLT